MALSADIEAIAETLLKQDCPVVLCLPGLKAPLPSIPGREPWGEVAALVKPDQVDTIPYFIDKYGRVNIGVFVGSEKRSPLLVVDMDGADGIERALTLGVNFTSTVWVSQTGKSRPEDPRYHVYYLRPDSMELPRVIRALGDPLDLLVNGYAVIPPSNTSLHSKAGGVYRWIPGHSPFEIPIADLDHPPRRLIECWVANSNSSERRDSGTNHRGDGPGWLPLVFEAICDYLENRGHRLHHTRSGAVSTTCPLHDDRSPSFSMHSVYGWKCFAGCGQGRLTLLAANLGIRIGGAER